MKSIKIKNQQIELEQKDLGSCNFCGEDKKVVIKSFIPTKAFFYGVFDYDLKYTYNVGDVNYRTVINNDGSIFFTKKEILPTLKNNTCHTMWCGEETETKEVDRDSYICHDCILQLAKQIK